MATTELPSRPADSAPGELTEPSWYPDATTTPEEAAAWLRDYSSWALADEHGSEDEDDDSYPDEDED